MNKKPEIGVGVMLLKNNEILLGKRNTDPKKADSELHGEGTWTMPGGKLHYKEELRDAAYREVLEETGIKIDKNKLELICVSDDIVEDAHFVTIGFLSRDFSGEARVMEEDIVEWKWFPIHSLPEPIFKPSQKIINSYLNGRRYSYL
jgi:8-oxo-dGTP diphosphatase